MILTRLISLFLLLNLIAPSMAATNLSSIECAPAQCLGGITAGEAGFLLAAPDRGYAGNQKVRQAFNQFSAQHNAELVFVTDQRMEPYLKDALFKLRDRNAQSIVVLPLFYSMSHPRLTLLRGMLKRINNEDGKLIYARSFGSGYLAVEMLIEHLKSKPFDESPALLLGHGGSSDKSFKLIERDLRRIADFALQDFENREIEIVVLPGDRTNPDYKTHEKKAWDAIEKLAVEVGVKDVFSLHMGAELDGMMAVDVWAESRLPKSMQLLEVKDNEVEFFSLWMHREANRYLSAEEAPLGIVFNAHGSDFHWNQAMRDAVEDLAKKYPVEFAFSMADPDDLSQAVARLEERGSRVIVIVRVFGMRASFRHATERLIGLDIDAPELCKTEDADDRHEGEVPPMRLRTNALVVTEGGLGNSPLFAKAMLDRANKLAVEKAKDTVILVAHGKGTDSANDQWLTVLASLAEQMKSMGGDEFKDIQYQTWQEDWKDKRGDRINAVVGMVEKANQDGGHAIVIPARTTGKGRAARFLNSVEFIAGEGFAPHPLFSQWVESQLKRGVETVAQTRHVWYPVLSAEQQINR